MKYTKTTLMELSRQYRNVLKKCALFNAAILMSTIIALPSYAATITEDFELAGEENEQHFNEALSIDANVTLTNTGIYTTEGYNFSVAGKTFVMSNSELGGHGSLDITGGTFTLSNDSEFSGEPVLNISDADITLNASHLLSRTDENPKGEINISDSTININKGFIGAFNYSDGGATGDHISEGAQINITGTSTLTFNGGNAIDDAQDWEEDSDEPAGGRFIANEILAEDINLKDSAELTVASGATLKTTQATFTNGEQIDFNIPAATINLKDNALLNLSGAIRANIFGSENADEAGTLNLLSSTALINGTISDIHLNVLASHTFDNQDILAHTVTVDDYAVLTFDGDTNDDGLYASVNELNIKNGSSVALSSTMAEYQVGEDGDLEPISHGVTVKAKNLTLEEDASLTLTGNGNHAADIGDVENALIKGTVVLTNGRLEAHTENDEDEGITNAHLTSITLDGAYVSMAGRSNMEAGGQFLVKNSSTVDVSSHEEGLVSATALIVQDSSISLTDSGHLISYKTPTSVDPNFINSTGILSIQRSNISMNDNSLLYGDSIELDQTSLNIFGENYLLSHAAEIALMNGTSVDIYQDATLSVLTGKELGDMDDAYINPETDTTVGLYKDLNPNKGTLNLGADSTLNLSGVLNANIATNNNSATVVINNESATINGNVDGVNLNIAENFDSKNLLGTVNNLEQLSITDGKSLTLFVDGNLTGEDEDLSVKSFIMGENSTLNLSGDKEDSELEASESIYATGTLALSSSGLKQGTKDGNGGDFTLTNATVTMDKWAGLTSRSQGHDMEISNSEITMEDAVIFKEVGSADMNISESEITMSSSENGFSTITNNTRTGNINVADSTITMNDRSIVSIGAAEYDFATNQFKMHTDGEYNDVEGTGEITLNNSTINMNGTSWIHSGVNKSVLLNGTSSLIVSGMKNQSSDISVDDTSTVTINANSELIANVVNKGTITNEGTIDGNVTNNGTYTGLISGVTGTLDNANGVVNTWGNLDKGLLGTTNLTDAATISKDLTFATLNVQNTLDVTNGTLTATTVTVDNGATLTNESTIDGNVTNNGTYTGLISGVTGTLDNANGVVNTWGNLDKGLLGTTNLTKASSLSKNATFGSVNVKNTLDLGTNTLTADAVTIGKNATLAFQVSGSETFGKIVADAITINATGTTISLTLDNGVLGENETKEFHVLNGTVNGQFANLDANERYNFEYKGDGIFAVTEKAAADDVIIDVGGDANDAAAADAWLNGGNFTPGSGATLILNILNTLSQQSAQLFKEAIQALQPDNAPTAQTLSTAINNLITGAVSGRFSGGFAFHGRSGGDTFNNAGLWAQGLTNKSKLSTSQGFDGKTYGLAMGADAEVSEGLKLGLGYAYTTTDIDSTGRSTDVDTHTAIAYAEKTFGNAFVNGVVTYGRSKYKEDKNVGGVTVKADYDMDTVFAQAMTGYHFGIKNAVLTPETGLRYLWTNTHSYTDSAGQNIKSDKTTSLTGVLGGRASMEFQTGAVTFKPELKLAATYDIKNDKGGASVRLANGASYAVTGDTLNRFGIETGAKVGMTVNNMEFSLNYEGKFKQHYSDHTGMINFRYNF